MTAIPVHLDLSAHMYVAGFNLGERSTCKHFLQIYLCGELTQEWKSI